MRKTSRDNQQVGLTSRQAEVLERLAQRKTLKAIAAELGVSEPTVNFHVRALKDAYAVNSLSELAEVYAEISRHGARGSYRKPIRTKYPVAARDVPVVPKLAKDTGPVFHLHDSLSYAASAPWEMYSEPDVVPGVLNGTNSKWVRAALIVAITVGLFVAVLVGLGVAQGVSAVFRSGRDFPSEP
jgi:DNA-binding CsgD family transcriptional regulator